MKLIIRHKTNQASDIFHQNQGVGMVVVGIAFALVGGLFVAGIPILCASMVRAHLLKATVRNARNVHILGKWN